MPISSASRPCQANNPLTCAYHGNRKGILTSSQAEKNHQQALSKLLTTKSSEALFQAYDNAKKVSDEMDITPEGLRKLADVHAAALLEDKYDLAQKHKYLTEKRKHLLGEYKKSACLAEQANPYDHIIVLDDEEATILTAEEAYDRNIILKRAQEVEVDDEVPGYGKVFSSYIEADEGENDKIRNYVEFENGLKSELQDSGTFYMFETTPVRISAEQKIEYDHLRSYHEGMIIINSESGHLFKITQKIIHPTQPHKVSLYATDVIIPSQRIYIDLDKNSNIYNIAEIVS